MNSPFKFLRRVRIHGGECGAVARALHHEVKGLSLYQADLEKSSGSTNERKQMSTKTTLKRIALVAVSALGFGLMSSVAPASAATSTGLTVAVGPNNATSLTVVSGNAGALALVRVDVAVDSATSATGHGLQGGETITASVTGVPTSVTAKTLLANGGSLADTATAAGSGFSDLVMINSAAQTSGTVAATVLAGTSVNTDWTKVADSVTATNMDTNSAVAPLQPSAARNSFVSGGTIDSRHTGYENKDGTHQTTGTKNTKSYYVTIGIRGAATVIDQGAYTIQFQLTDAYGLVRATKTIKIDFVSAASKSDAVVTLATNGTFIRAAALATQDTSTSAYVSLTLRNRDGGLIRLSNGALPAPVARVERSTTAAPVYAETGTVTAADDGAYGADFGRDSTTSPGNGTLQKADGVYGLATTLPNVATATGNAYRILAGYGNSTIVTSAITVFEAGGSGTADAARTDALLTATGMSAADQLLKSNSATSSWTVPATTKSASLRFYIQTSADTATPAALITVVPTWSGAHGSASVTPATSTTGTVYTTDANGVIDVSITNSAPVDGAVLTLALSGGAAFGAGTHTATITWAASVATTIAVADPISGVYVKTGSTNVTTVIVKDQFGAAVANQSVTVTLGSTSANYSATTTIAPITTGASGTATYSLVGGATTATLDTISFQCAPTACGTAASMTYNYVSTVPAVGTMTAYHGYTQATAGTTLTPSTGIYQSGTSTELVLRTNRDQSKSLLSFSDSATDDMINLRFYGLTSAGVAATGAVVKVTAGAGGHILDASGLPVSSRDFLILSTGYTDGIRVMATKTGAITFTATSGTVTATASMWVKGATADARFVAITSAATGTANGTGVPVTVSVTDRYGNAVSGVALNVTASGVGSFMGGGVSTSFTTDASGVYTFLANSLVAEGGTGTFSVSSGTTSDMSSAAGYVGATAVDSTLAAGNSTASASIKFAAGISSAVAAGNAATAAAEAATDAAAEAIDAANAATDAANLAAEAADAATVAAEEARDAADAATAAVEELATQVATLMAALKAQITTLANTVAKIAKKVKA